MKKFLTFILIDVLCTVSLVGFSQQRETVYAKKIKGYETLLGIDSFKAAKTLDIVENTMSAAHSLRNAQGTAKENSEKVNGLIYTRNRELLTFLSKEQLAKILEIAQPMKAVSNTIRGSIVIGFTKDFGTLNAEGEYYDSQLSEPIVRDDNTSRPIYTYKFKIVAPTQINISTCASEIGTKLGITKYDDDEKVVPFDNKVYESGPLCFDLNGSFVKTFTPGVYYLTVQSAGFDTGYIITNVSATGLSNLPSDTYDPSGAGVLDLAVAKAVDNLTQNLNKTEITTGILYPRSTQFTNLDGYYDTPNISYEGPMMQLAYKELYLSAYDKSDMLPPDDLFDLENTAVEPGSSYLNIINYDINVLDSLSFQKGLLTLDNNGLPSDVPGRSSSPYLTKHVAIVSPAKTTFGSDVLNLKVSNFSVSERSSKHVSSITCYSKAIGYSTPVATIPITNDQHNGDPNNGSFITVSYDTPMTDTIRAVLTYSDFTTDVAYFPVHMNFANPNPDDEPDPVLAFSASQERESNAHIGAKKSVSGTSSNDKTTNVKAIKAATADPSTFTRQTKGVVDEFFNFTASIPFQGSGENAPRAGLGHVDIFYAVGNQEKKLKKPIILINGFDPTGLVSGLKIYNEISRYFYRRSSDPAKNDPSQFGVHYLGSELRLLGYDLVILTFPGFETKPKLSVKITPFGLVPSTINVNTYAHGADFIERNAFVLYDLINTCNQRLKANGSSEKLVIIGPSMGSLISKYALSYMEKRSIDHNTRLWLSFDGPHQGANVPLGAQAFIDYGADDLALKEARDNRDYKIGSPAAREMLIDFSGAHVYSDVLNRNSYDVVCSPYRTTFLKNLKDVGDFPQKLRKVAISNGSGNGLAQKGKNGARLAPCSVLIDFTASYRTPLAPNITFGLEQQKLRTSALGANNQICNVFFGNQLGGNLRGTNSANSGPASLDVAPGGYTTMVTEALAEGSLASVTDFLSRTFASGRLLSDNRQTTFIPTVSALAINGVPDQFQFGQIDYGQIIGNRNLLCEQRTPFDAYYAPDDNEDHVSLNTKNVAFITQELAGDISGSSGIGTYPNSKSFGDGGYSFAFSTDNALRPGDILTITLNGPPAISIRWTVDPKTEIIDGQGTTQFTLQGVGSGGPGYFGNVTAYVLTSCGSYVVTAKLGFFFPISGSSTTPIFPNPANSTATIDFASKSSLANALQYVSPNVDTSQTKQSLTNISKTVTLAPKVLTTLTVIELPESASLFSSGSLEPVETIRKDAIKQSGNKAF